MPTVPTWVQSALFEADIVEVTAFVGWISEPEHVQVQVETRDPITGNLLDLWSMPHSSHKNLRHLLVPMFLRIIEHLQTNVVHTEDSRRELEKLYAEIGGCSGT